MKRVHVLALVLSGICLALVELPKLDLWINSHRIVPGPENQSRFFRGYDPEHVIAAFRSATESYSKGGSLGASLDYQYVKHFADFQSYFVIESDRKAKLLAALNDDIWFQLSTTGTKVLERVETPDGGFRYDYETPNGLGSISVRPPEQDNHVQRNHALPSQHEDFSLNIALEETWNRPPPHKWIIFLPADRRNQSMSMTTNDAGKLEWTTASYR